MKHGNGLEIVLNRTAFYRDNYLRVRLLCWAFLFVNIILAAMLVYKILTPPQPVYFATTDDGRMVRLYPLSDPQVSNNYVVQWASVAAEKAYSLDYAHWQQQLQDATNYFTGDGWADFVTKLKASNNLTTILNYKMVSSAEITGAPQVLEQGVVNGRYTWKVQFPVLVTYDSNDKVIHQPLMITINIVRTLVTENPARIAINSFVADTEQVNTAKAQLGLS